VCTWWVRLTIVTSIFAMIDVAAPPLAAPVTLSRFVSTVQAFALTPERLPSLAELTLHCRGDALCAARHIVVAMGPRAALMRVQHPDTDAIRWVTTKSSVVRVTDDGLHRLIALRQFGRKVTKELLSALNMRSVGPLTRAVVLDLRCNHGGDFDRMIRVAGLFIGPVAEAVTLVGHHGRMTVDIPTTVSRVVADSLTVYVGPETASSAEVLAILLKRYVGATIVGQVTYGKDFLVRVIPVTHDWNLLLPSAIIEVSGYDLSAGIVPDQIIQPDSSSCE
jgi:hypothetical protein